VLDGPRLVRPGKNWVFMLKGRFLYNTFNSEMSVLARPELTYFLIVDRVPVLNVTASYEMYFPLNFGSTVLYQTTRTPPCCGTRPPR
jgi:hypothetical protein